MNKVYLQITSGRGPVECCRVVAKVLEILLAEARQNGIDAEVIEREEGVVHHTLFSAVALLQGSDLDKFLASWEGTVLWIAQSTYRPFHKRKNWFVGVQRLIITETSEFDERDIQFQTLRASGPGGQHVNKTESAVRAIHISTGLSAVASDERSQLQNKKLALERLKALMQKQNAEAELSEKNALFFNHNNLVRGFAVRVYEGEDFKRTK